MLGLIDKPIETMEDDRFEVKNYIEALSNFIQECDTPMTIAVQGDWGSGKTSIMNMVKNHLKNQVIPIWFNTWQFSKFNMDDKLSFSLLLTLAAELDKRSPPSPHKKNLISIVSTFAWKILSYSADAVGASKISEDASQMAEKFSAPEDTSPFVSIINLKNHFQESINEITKTGKKIVIFIDDLDRLEPMRALDVLEVLKLFLDCQNCVYVLAIDYGVVTRGVKEKYGDDLEGKQFFDKIIQLPFYMPVAHYDIQGYVTNALGKNLPKDVIEKYVNLIRCSVGCNPRTMKRLFNAFKLISMIYGNKGNEWQRTLLFALLCLQLTYEDVYNYLVENMGKLGEKEYNFFLTGNSDDAEKAFALESQTVEKKEDIYSFMEQLATIIANGKNIISNDDIEAFKEVLSQSTTTNNTAVTSKTIKPELTEDKTGEKTLTDTDVKYKICCLGSGFQLGYGKKITVEVDKKIFEAKMHNTSAGRIDGLSQIYKDNSLHTGDRFNVQYKYKERKVILSKLP